MIDDVCTTLTTGAAVNVFAGRQKAGIPGVEPATDFSGKPLRAVEDSAPDQASCDRHRGIGQKRRSRKIVFDPCFLWASKAGAMAGGTGTNKVAATIFTEWPREGGTMRLWATRPGST